MANWTRNQVWRIIHRWNKSVRGTGTTQFPLPVPCQPGKDGIVPPDCPAIKKDIANAQYIIKEVNMFGGWNKLEHQMSASRQQPSQNKGVAEHGATRVQQLDSNYIAQVARTAITDAGLSYNNMPPASREYIEKWVTKAVDSVLQQSTSRQFVSTRERNAFAENLMKNWVQRTFTPDIVQRLK